MTSAPKGLLRVFPNRFRRHDSPHILTGRLGEYLAEGYLRRIGLRLVHRNVRLENGELDLVMTDGKQIVFVEVKTRTISSERSTERMLDPLLNVSTEKSARLHQLALAYLRIHFGKRHPSYRVDLVAVELDPKIVEHSAIRHLRGEG